MEILAGLAAASRFAVMHAYEALAHLRATRQPVSHGKLKAKSSLLKISHQLSEIHKIKEILAAIAAAEVDKLIKTNGLDWAARHRTRQLARHHAHHLAHERYGLGRKHWLGVRSRERRSCSGV